MSAKLHNPSTSPSIAGLAKRTDDLWIQKINWVVDKVAEYKSQGKRVLIYVKDGIMSSLLNQIILGHGFDSNDMANMTSTSQRVTAVLEFNDSAHATDALITTFTVGKEHRFYGACDRGLIFDYPTIMEDYVFAARCLNSTGQTEDFQWFNCYIHGTMDMMHELVLTRSALPRIIWDVDLYPGVTGELRRICAFYSAALALGQSSSRYPRARVHWSNMESVEIKREGLFYSAVAKFLVENPECASKFTSETMSKIARSWKPEERLTMDHVDCKLPEHEDGVVLYNYVVGGYKKGML
ncbi:hypothetical protein FGRMN_5193 [Fusarium graminum]|nr:hypothetical protein FGRMN_5193 [Fusarium graminum]